MTSSNLADCMARCPLHGGSGRSLCVGNGHAIAGRSIEQAILWTLNISAAAFMASRDHNLRLLDASETGRDGL
jgi:hypothetical protein